MRSRCTMNVAQQLQVTLYYSNMIQQIEAVVQAVHEQLQRDATLQTHPVRLVQVPMKSRDIPQLFQLLNVILILCGCPDICPAAAQANVVIRGGVKDPKHKVLRLVPSCNGTIHTHTHTHTQRYSSQLHERSLYTPSLALTHECHECQWPCMNTMRSGKWSQ